MLAKNLNRTSRLVRILHTLKFEHFHHPRVLLMIREVSGDGGFASTPTSGIEIALPRDVLGVMESSPQQVAHPHLGFFPFVPQRVPTGRPYTLVQNGLRGNLLMSPPDFFFF